MSIRFCETDTEILATFETMCELRPDLTDSETYLNSVKRLMTEANFQLAAFWDAEQVTAVVGFHISACLAWGKYLYVADLVTNSNFRSNGQGKALIDWVSNLAREAGCEQLHLDSGVQRHAAHRFYLRERFDIMSYHFSKNL